MKASELIEELSAKIEEKGDYEVGFNKISYKYLDECGFDVYPFGTYKDGDVCLTSPDDEVCAKVSPQVAKEIEAYIKRLEERVKSFIGIHYQGKRG